MLESPAAPGPRRAVPRRWLALTLLATLFLATRLLLVLCAADRLSEPDAAETKLMEVGDRWVQEGAPSVAALLRLARAGTNAPHGGYLIESIAYSAVVVAPGAAGSYLALKLVLLGFGALGIVCWTLAAARLGGRRAAGAMALLQLLPPPLFLAGSCVAWGSHPEVAGLLGALALALLTPGCPPSAKGALAGLCAGWDLLAAPMVGVMLLAAGWLETVRGSGPRTREAAGESARAARRAASALGAGAAVLAGMLWVSGGLQASVTEDPGRSPIEIVAGRAGAGGAEPAPWTATLGELLPLPWLEAAPFGPEPLAPRLRERLDLALSLLLALAVLAGLASRPTDRAAPARDGAPEARPSLLPLALCLAVPLVHVAVVARYAPRAPDVPVRYLLPMLPFLQVGLALAAARLRWGLGWLAVAACALPGLAVQARLMQLSRISSFFDYRPAAWVVADIGHVRYDTAPGVNAFLAQRREFPRGFGLAAGPGAADDLLLQPPGRQPVQPQDVLGRLAAELPLLPEDPAVLRRVHENLGWGLAVMAPERPAVWLSVLSHLGDWRDAAAEGLGRGLLHDGERGCGRLLAERGPDGEAMRRGARAEASAANLFHACELAEP